MAIPIVAIAGVVQLAVKAIPVVQNLIEWITETFKKAREAGHEFTPEEEAAYQAWQDRVFASPQAKIRPNPGPSPPS